MILYLVLLTSSDHFLPSQQLSLLLVQVSDLRPNVLNFLYLYKLEALQLLPNIIAINTICYHNL